MADEQDRKVNQIIAAFLEAEEAGEAPAQDDLLRQHPELAEELQSFFDGREQFQKVAENVAVFGGHKEPPSESHDTPTADTGATAALESPSKTVRYFGDYELLEKMGEGGMGVVYKARQISLNRPVAIKMIRAGQFADKSELDRFRAEAEAVANLDHPHIVPIYEVGEHEGQPYFSMKLIEGGSLEKNPHRFEDNPKAIAQFMQSTARAVHHAHQRGVIHRDLKPGNILIDGAGQPHVTDFGLAKKIKGGKGLTQTGAIVGTAEYMAPEQAQSKSDLTIAVDVCSLGAVLFKLLTGKPPFQGDGFLETIKMVCEEEPDKPRSINPKVPLDLETICLKCLEKEPQHRYRSALEFADDLERWLDGEPIQARRVTPWERLVKWAKRNPVATALVGTVVFSLVVLLVFGLYFNAALQRLIADNQTKQGELDKAAKETNLAKHQAQAFRKSAKQTKLDAEKVLGRVLVADGMRHWDNDDHGAALLLFAAAVKRDAGDPDRQKSHRVRFQSFRRGMLPRLVHIIEHENLSGVDMSPDERYIVTSGNKEVRVWDTVTGRLSYPPMNHSDKSFFGAEFSKDGQHIYSSDCQTSVRIWNATTGKLKHTIPTKTGYRSIARISSDGKRMLVIAYGNIRDYQATVWDVTSGKRILGPIANVKTDGKPPAIVLSRDGQFLLNIDGKNLEVWEIKSGQKRIFKHAANILCCGISPDSEKIIAGCDDKTAHIWNRRTGKPLMPPLAHKAPVSFVRFSPNGDLVCLTGRGPAPPPAINPALSEADISRVWDCLAKKPVTDFINVYSDVYWGIGLQQADNVVFSPDGQWFLTQDRKLYETRSRAAPVQMSLPNAGHYQQILTISPDGSRILAASGQKVFLRDVALTDKNLLLGAMPQSPFRLTGDTQTMLVGETRQGHTTPASASFSSSGRFVFAWKYGEAVKVWDTVVAEPFAQIIPTAGSPRFSPNSQQLLTRLGPIAMSDVPARLWNPNNGKEIPIRIGKKRIGDIAWQKGNVHYEPFLYFDRTGRLMLAVVDDKSTRLIDGQTGKQSVPTIDAAVTAITTSDDGLWLVTSERQREQFYLRIRDSITGRVLKTLPGAPVDRIIIDKTKTYVISLDHPVVSWNIPSGRKLTGPDERPKIGNGNIAAQSATVSSNSGFFIVQKNEGRFIQVFDAKTCKPVAPAQRFKGMLAKAPEFSPDGKYVLLIYTAKWMETGDGNMVREVPTKFGGFAVRILESASGKMLLELAGKGVQGPAIFSSDNKFVVWQDDRGIYKTNLNTKRTTPFPIRTKEKLKPAWLRFSPDGERLLIGDFRIWDMANNAFLTPQLQFDPFSEAFVSSLPELGPTFSPDGNKVVSTVIGAARVWDFSTNTRPADDIVQFAQVYSGRKLNEQGQFDPLTAKQVARMWKELKHKYPEELAFPTDEQRVKWLETLLDRSYNGIPSLDSTNLATRKHFLDQLIRLQPKRGKWYADRAELLFSLDQWDRAAKDVRKAIALGHKSRNNQRILILIQIRDGDINGYQKTCKELVERWLAGSDSVSEETLSWAPNPPELINAAIKQRKLAAKNDPLLLGGELDVNHTTRGRLLYLAGGYKEALKHLIMPAPKQKEEFSVPEYTVRHNDPDHWLFLAMTYYKLKQKDKAEVFWKKSRKWIADAEKKLQQTGRFGGGSEAFEDETRNYYRSLEEKVLLNQYRRRAEQLFAIIEPKKPNN